MTKPPPVTAKPKALPPLPPTWDHSALLAKAELYAEQMLTHPKEDWLFGFWSSLVVELLGRAALAKISPTLLADGKDWNNILYATGGQPTASRFTAKSIDTNQVFSRLKEIYPSFTQELENFCAIHSNRRNAELHSGETPFASLKESTWLPAFYSTSDSLLSIMGSDLGSFFGKEEALYAKKIIAAAEDKAAQTVKGLVKAHQTVWKEKDEDEQDALSSQAKVWSAKHFGHRVKCPSCECRSLVYGEASSAAKKTIDGDTITEKQSYTPNRFECIACGLKLSGLASLHAVGLSDSFTKTQTYEASEYYSESQDDNYYEPDFND